MIANGLQDRNGKVEEYLQLLRLLACELERAMHAIEQNSLPEFEDCVCSQAELSARLTELAGELNLSAQSGEPSIVPRANDKLMMQIQAASGTLQSLNQSYAALLQHSSRSVALMVSLFDSFKGNLQEGTGARSKIQTWSCQM
jgi:hypothetical protein